MKHLLMTIIEKMEFNETFVYDHLENKEISYAVFFDMVLQEVKKLEDIDYDGITVIAENGVFLMMLYFAALFANKTIYPIDNLKSATEKEEICKLISNSLLIRQEENGNYNIDFGENLCKSPVEIQGNENGIKQSVIEKANLTDFEKPYLVTFTSGTTGVSKGVVHSANNLFAAALALSEAVETPINSRFLHTMPMTYMAGILNSIFYPFISRQKIVIAGRFDVKKAISFWSIVEKYGITCFWLAPFMLSMILKVDRTDRGKKYCAEHDTYFMIGTAALSSTVRKEFEARYDTKLYVSYGLSETLFVSIGLPETSFQGESVGEILNGVSIECADDGELLISVPWMLLDYVNTDTTEYFKEIYYKSGDLGMMVKNSLYITGRKKDLIIRGGINISPVKIERAIQEINDEWTASVVGGYDKQYEEKICCALAIDGTYDEEKVKNVITKEIKKQLGNNYMIDNFMFMTALPLNLNGKVDKKIIKKLFEEKMI